MFKLKYSHKYTFHYFYLTYRSNDAKQKANITFSKGTSALNFMNNSSFISCVKIKFLNK